MPGALIFLPMHPMGAQNKSLLSRVGKITYPSGFNRQDVYNGRSACVRFD